MAKDPEHKSEFEQSLGHEPDDELEDDVEEVEEPSFEQPFCPRCGWHNTRPSHTANLLDLMVRMFGFRPFRCRSCGNRFRAIRRAQKT